MTNPSPDSTSAPTAEEFILEEWNFGDPADDELAELTAVLVDHARPGTWLDLGCGPLLPVWPMFVNGITEITGCDRLAEVADFHAKLRANPAVLPLGLELAREYARQRGAERELALGKVVDVVTASVLERQSRWADRFDNVIQIGCFGCLESMEELAVALSNVASYLRRGGTFISETWSRRAGHHEIDKWSGDPRRVLSGRLSAQGMARAIEHAGLEIRAVRTTPMETIYEDRFVIVAAKPQ